MIHDVIAPSTFSIHVPYGIDRTDGVPKFQTVM